MKMNKKIVTHLLGKNDEVKMYTNCILNIPVQMELYINKFNLYKNIVFFSYSGLNKNIYVVEDFKMGQNNIIFNNRIATILLYMNFFLKNHINESFLKFIFYSMYSECNFQNKKYIYAAALLDASLKEKKLLLTDNDADVISEANNIILQTKFIICHEMAHLVANIQEDFIEKYESSVIEKMLTRIMVEQDFLYIKQEKVYNRMLEEIICDCIAAKMIILYEKYEPVNIAKEILKCLISSFFIYCSNGIVNISNDKIDINNSELMLVMLQFIVRIFCVKEFLKFITYHNYRLKIDEDLNKVTDILGKNLLVSINKILSSCDEYKNIPFYAKMQNARSEVLSKYSLLFSHSVNVIFV